MSTPINYSLILRIDHLIVTNHNSAYDTPLLPACNTQQRKLTQPQSFEVKSNYFTMYEDEVEIVINPATNPYYFVLNIDSDSDSDCEGTGTSTSKKAQLVGSRNMDKGSIPRTEVQLLVDAILTTDASHPAKDSRPIERIRHSYAEAHGAPAIPLSATDEDVEILALDFETNDGLYMSYEENALLYYSQSGVVALADVKAILPLLNCKPRVIQEIVANIGYFYSTGAITDAQLEALLVHIFQYGDQTYRIFEAAKASIAEHKQRREECLHQRQQPHPQSNQQRILLQHPHPHSQQPMHAHPSNHCRTLQTPPKFTRPTPPPTLEKSSPLWNHTKPSSNYLFKKKKDIAIQINLPPPPTPQQGNLCAQATVTDAKVGKQSGPLTFSAKTEGRRGGSVVVRVSPGLGLGLREVCEEFKVLVVGVGEG